jgi:hypothetical protein
MLKSEISLYALGVGAGLLGTLIAKALGWSGDALFAAWILPVWGVLLVFMLREPRSQEIQPTRRGPFRSTS